MSGPVELVRSLKAAYEQALDVIDGGRRTPTKLFDQVVPAVVELKAERDRLLAERDELGKIIHDLFFADRHHLTDRQRKVVERWMFPDIPLSADAKGEERR